MCTMIHPKIIFHIDIDYFYAQVEEIMNPELKNKPFGVQQGLNVVTCNYIAREYGIGKWKTVSECLSKCPEMVLVNGEDLSNYKDFSVKVSEYLNEILGPSERMGLDEHTVDITKHVEQRLNQLMNSEDGNDLENLRFSGPFYPSEEAFKECDCGCDIKLMIGSQIAQEVRDKIFEKLKITCSAGVAHNKFLAKLCGGLNKPNNQTTLAPLSAAQFMVELNDLRKITGIGEKTGKRIAELNIKNIEDLQNSDIEKLKEFFSLETATRLKEVSMGIDHSDVKPTGKPKTVGLDDSCTPTRSKAEAQDRFKALLKRLVKRIESDTRIPQSLQVTLRKYDFTKKISVRESKQIQLLPSHFTNKRGKLEIAEEKVLEKINQQYDLMIKKDKFPINLFGLSFGKFQEIATGSSSIENFVKKEPIQPPPKRLKLEVESEINNNNTSLEESPKIPPSVDPKVWSELPSGIQQELMRNWHHDIISRASKSPTNSRVKNVSISKYFTRRP